jgi:hypothetical protein
MRRDRLTFAMMVGDADHAAGAVRLRDQHRPARLPLAVHDADHSEFSRSLVGAAWKLAISGSWRVNGREPRATRCWRAARRSSC